MTMSPINPTLLRKRARGLVALACASLALGGCAVVPADEVSDLLSDATFETRFVEEGVAYRLEFKPQLPGDGC